MTQRFSSETRFDFGLFYCMTGWWEVILTLVILAIFDSGNLLFSFVEFS